MYEYFMKIALQEAQAAMGEGEVPVGAVIVEGLKQSDTGIKCAIAGLSSSVFPGFSASTAGQASSGTLADGDFLVGEGRIIARAHNQRETLHDPTAHAEMIAITQAAEAKNSWRLDDCTLFVTLEPCPMCAGAILQARIPTVVYGAADPKAGAVDTLYRLLDDPRLNHRCLTSGGVLAEQCGGILSEFFRRQRLLGKK